MTDELFVLLTPAITGLGLELVDVELSAGVARVVLDRPGGIDLDALGEATKVVSALLDRHDPFPGQRYTLEVTSPGLERVLRRPEHFERAVGSLISLRTRPGAGLARRIKGRLVTASGAGVTLAEEAGQPWIDEPSAEGGAAVVAERVRERFITYEEIERARTVFEWPVANRAGRDGRPDRANRAPKASRSVTANRVPTVNRAANANRARRDEPSERRSSDDPAPGVGAGGARSSRTLDVEVGIG